jgi:hypothetical protein
MQNEDEKNMDNDSNNKTYYSMPLSVLAHKSYEYLSLAYNFGPTIIVWLGL